MPSNYLSRDERRKALLAYREQTLLTLIETHRAWNKAQSNLLAERPGLNAMRAAAITEHNQLFDEQVLPLAQEVEKLYEAGHQRQAIQPLRKKTEGLFELHRLTQEQRGYRLQLNQLYEAEHVTFTAYQEALQQHRLIVNVTNDLLTDEAAQELFQSELKQLREAGQ